MNLIKSGSRKSQIMKKFKYICILTLLAGFISCKSDEKVQTSHNTREHLNQIIDISYTPSESSRCIGWFVDQGSWMGFTPAQKDNWVNGVCGPYSLDSRLWLAKSAVTIEAKAQPSFQADSVNYYPGGLFIQGSNGKVAVSQRLVFADATTAILHIKTDGKSTPELILKGDGWMPGSTFSKDRDKVIVNHPNGEITTLCFNPEIKLEVESDNYKAITDKQSFYVAISYFVNHKEKLAGIQKAQIYLEDAELVFSDNVKRWNKYLDTILRDDMPDKNDRVAAKSLVTLISNWKVSRGGLLHEGMVPSHAVGYFMGYWAWDTWKFAVPLAKVTPELAKNMIRSMFDYQLEDGMIIDCIYADSSENNPRDSKPPLAGWAIAEVFKQTNDTAFLKEMYPQLLSYHQWWYEKRDHDKNGICEFGSTDGTVEAAAWESGMDNAIRFDNSKMVQNGPDAWSFDQESVDLNAYLAYEYRLLKEFASILNVPFVEKDYTAEVAQYFFDDDTGFYYDRKLSDKSFIKEQGSEAYIPFWTSIATKDQMNRAMVHLTDTTKFSTYIPFPTIAADNPKYMSRGYWRGPIWLDQTYFAIKGLRNYGYNDLADKYTEQVFERLNGLIGDQPIHENYDSHTGERLKAPHFSWSSSHLLLLYEEYGK